MTREIMISVLLDAFRFDYFPSKHMPFLTSIAQEGISGSLIPPFGFEPDGAYLAGLDPEEYNGGMHYSFAPDRSPFGFVSGWGQVATFLPYHAQLIVRRVIRKIVETKAQEARIKKNASPARIPLSFLPFFDFVQKCFPFEPGFCSAPTIFDHLKAAGKQWVYLGNPLEQGSSELVLRKLGIVLKGDLDFVFLSIGDLDRVGHKFGPESSELRETLKKLDYRIERAYELLKGKYNQVKMLVFGDHGMVPVSKSINIKEVLERLSLKPLDDYVYFLDSTLARFWVFNKEAERVLKTALQDLEGGRLLTDRDMKVYRIRYQHRRFGDLLFWCDGGNIIFPNFFQDRTPPYGMHGYPTEEKRNHAAFILYGSVHSFSKVISDPLPMVDIFPTLLDMSGLKIEEQRSGTSILNHLK